MAQLDKLIKKIFSNSQIKYDEAEKILLYLGFDLEITSSHHIFRKIGHKTISIKKRKELLPYQIKDLKQVLLDHGYEK